MTGPSLYSPQVQEMVEQEFNALPLFINQNDPDDLNHVLNMCDFVVLAGGSDWSPTSTGGEMFNHENLEKFDFARDKRELFIMNWAKENNKKLFGICRGHQGVGLFHNMYLSLDITGSTVVHQPSAAGIKTEGNPVHFVRCLPEFKEEFFDEELTNSWHHQALLYFRNKNYAEDYGVEVLGTANLNYNDKEKYNVIVELMRTVDNNWLSCQWHPELDYKTNVASRKVVDKFKQMIGI